MPEAKVMEVIQTTLGTRGDGETTPKRRLTQYWSKDGKLLATVDPLDENSPDIDEIRRAAKLAYEEERMNGTKLPSLDVYVAGFCAGFVWESKRKR